MLHVARGSHILLERRLMELFVAIAQIEHDQRDEDEQCLADAADVHKEWPHRHEAQVGRTEHMGEIINPRTGQLNEQKRDRDGYRSGFPFQKQPQRRQ